MRRERTAEAHPASSSSTWTVMDVLVAATTKAALSSSNTATKPSAASSLGVASTAGTCFTSKVACARSGQESSRTVAPDTTMDAGGATVTVGGKT